MKPISGTSGIYNSPVLGDIRFDVIRVDGNLCWSVYHHETMQDQNPQSFIWNFKDGLNNLHHWQGKENA